MRQLICVTTQMRSNANVIYQHLEKFDREKKEKSQSVWQDSNPLYSVAYRIAGNFRGRKLSRISQFFSHPRMFYPRNSRHATPIMRPVLHSAKVFSAKCSFPSNPRKFSPSKISRYTVHKSPSTRPPPLLLLAAVISTILWTNPTQPSPSHTNPANHSQPSPRPPSPSSHVYANPRD